GRRRQRHTDFEPPLLAVGKLRDGHVSAARQADHRQGAVDLRLEPWHAIEAPQKVERKRAPPFGERGNYDVVAYRQPIEELVHLITLGQSQLAHTGHVHACDITAMKEDAPARRLHLAGQHLEEGALAGSIGANDAAQLSLADRKIDVLVREKAAE